MPKSFTRILSKPLTPQADKPFRSEMLSKELLGLHAIEVAKYQTPVGTSVRQVPLKSRFKENCRSLNSVYFSLSEIASQKGYLAAGAEWLLDNYHVIDEQVREIRRDLPASYYRALARISSGAWKGYPRVFRISCDYIEHTDSIIQLDTLSEYCKSYQTEHTLHINELWAIPIMLRLALVENLKRLSQSVLKFSLEREKANILFNKIVYKKNLSATEILSQILLNISPDHDSLEVLVPILANKLRSIGSNSSLGIQWLEEKLREKDIQLAEATRSQQQLQAADQISIGNAITSLKSIGRLDWREWVESQSLVTQLLESESSGIFARSDFYTRDLIRHTIETLARKTKTSETDVAKKVLELTEENESKQLEEATYHTTHVGYYLIDEGLHALKKILYKDRSYFQKLKNFVHTYSFTVYAGLVLFLSILISASLFITARSYSYQTSIASLLFIFALLPASQLALEFLQWLSSKCISPNPLPKLDFEKSIPENAATLVVVQSILSNKENLLATIEDLEIRAIGNKDKHISFGILADLPDSTAPENPGDTELISIGINRIRELNELYKEEEIHFFILYRERKWNPSEQAYIGWERKRGKLVEFNRLLRNREDTSFTTFEADLSRLRKAQFVITLDNDTQLPPGSAKKLIGCAAHPLNIAIYDSEKKNVTRGYGIIQPRVGITLESATATRFSSLYSGQSGLDPYTRTISDLYQDLFKEASFIGKGIYHINTFYHAFDDRFPENSILSHDLLESGYVRCGLASDIEVFDEFPKRYHSYAKRQHRWIRGDWQLLQWLGSKTPVDSGTEQTALSPLVRWKLFDNLRRSLVPVSTTALLLTLCSLSSHLLTWVLVFFLLTAFRSYSVIYSLLFQIPVGYSLSTHFISLGRDIKSNLCTWMFDIITLPHQVFISLDAISRTLFRVFVTKQNLLEWETALSSELRLKPTLRSFIITMSFTYLFTAVALTTLVLFGITISWATLALCSAWVSSPIIAWYLSQDIIDTNDDISKADSRYLLKIAYDTWRYFRNHLSEQYHYLIPDNIQLIPQPVVAERTSPTNISLSLISLTSAYDLGFIPSTTQHALSKKIIETVKKLERFHGHLLNWYAIEDLRPLHPRYISSVDSGNFVGHLMVVKEALRTIPYAGFITEQHLAFLSSELASDIEISGTTSLHDVYKSIVPILSELSEKISSSTFSENSGLSSTGKELIQDLSSIIPYTLWISKLCILEELGRIHVLPKKLERIHEILKNRPLTPALAHKIVSRLLASKEKIYSVTLSPEQKSALDDLYQTLSVAENSLSTLMAETLSICNDIETLIVETEFEFLFDPQKKLLSIGYNIETASLDSGSYDLLASEARLASFVGIAKGDLPHVHWFFLGRALTESSGGKALVSWSGTMFEYLMPLIVMKNYPSTLLGKTYRAIIKAQQAYCSRRGVPWGISESAYGTVDFENTYQYRAFGVPGLGLKRGLIEDLVISPYSSALGLQIAAAESTKNLHALETMGARGEYGFYEAIDYTPERLTSEESFHIIKSFFAHHQGMTIAAINNVLNNNKLQERFHKDLRVQSCTLLLQERFPVRIPLILPHQAELLLIESIESESRINTQEHFDSPHQSFPRTHLLSNGEYTVCIDHRGNGFSSLHNNFFLNRYRHNTPYSDFGQYFYIKDEKKNIYWSNTYNPSKIEPDHYEVLFAPDKAEFQRRDFDIHTLTEVIISPEDNLEIRRIGLTNHSQSARKLSVTSYLEIALAPVRADLAHPAFSKLFLETYWVPYPETLICKRKPRAGENESPVLFHFAASEVVWEPTQYTTNRLDFIGRGRTLSNPSALSSTDKLNKKTGFELDPCASIRQVIELNPGESTNVYFISGFASNEEEALYLCKKYKEIQSIRRATELAWSHANVEQKNQLFSKASTVDFQHLGNAILYTVPELRERKDKEPPSLSQTGLWRLGISGDEPVVLFLINDNHEIAGFHEMILAHEFLRSRGVSFDLVVLNEKSDGYLQELHEELEASVRASLSAHLLNQTKGIFIRSRSHISDEEFSLLRSSASLILDASKGELSSQLVFSTKKLQPRWTPQSGIRSAKAATTSPGSKKVTAASEPTIGKFIKGGRGYQLQVSTSSLPPLPWSNIIANKDMGFLVTETGAGYSWIGNSRENRISTWSNDPVIDPHSEVLYIRDCENSNYWCPTILPVPSEGSVEVVHEPGLTSFKRSVHGICSTLDVFVSPDAPSRFWLLHLKNETAKPRTLEVILYIEWILGISRSESSSHLYTGIDTASGFLYAKNHWNEEFKSQYVILGSNLPIQDYTTEQKDFLGEDSSIAQPMFLETLKRDQDTRIIKSKTASGSTLSRKTGYGFDSAGILKFTMEIPPGSTSSIEFYLSHATSLHEAKERARSLNRLSFVEKEKEKAIQSWDVLLDKIQVETPDNEFNILVNTWLPYQTLACRMYAKTGFYQSSGAFGFRDQLQDSLAFLYTEPSITRQQILVNCTRQFEEGDVQHWWHPPSGRGIRSRISDNYLWMPYALLEYLDATGDESILEESAPYIKGPQLSEGQHDLYFTPEPSELHESVFEHCIRALDISFPTGPHGLPLIGTGDWNDGMNMVGEKGVGESVWLGWFLASILSRFSRLCEKRNRHENANAYQKHSDALVQAIESHAWDGEWYRRAYFDDGTPLGASERDECRIDSLAQSWSVITGLGNPERRTKALQSAYTHLFDKENQLVRLLWPPFQHGVPTAGYIQSYPPGIRENGGQYTHGSSWLIAALAIDGFKDEAMELFRAMNPINHTNTIEKAKVYKTEPYVTCGDVYSHEQHAGRGGWSWYTGSSGWLYQIAIRYLLGIKISREGLSINPRIPSDWKGFTLKARLNNKQIHLAVRSSNEKYTCTLNGQIYDNEVIAWDDLGGGTNEIEVNVL
jgi:cyclic beta-1,2-glucan synthetase